MPNSKSPPAHHRTQPGRRKTKIALGVLALLAVLVAWGWQPLRAQAQAGTAFGARIGCSCRHIDGRELADCDKDFVSGMGLVSLSEDEARQTVTASIPLLASTTATFRDGWGCVLDPYEG